mgnify:CR=1 FL=1
MVHELCRDRITIDCSVNAIETLNINSDVIDKCVDNTFAGEDWEADNMVFSQFAQEWKNYGHNLYPSVIINGKTFRGRMTPDNVYEAVCAAYDTEPKQCRVWQ